MGKVRDYVEYTLKENERGGVYFRFKSKKFPLSTRIPIGIFIGISSIICGYFHCRSRLNYQTEQTGHTTQFLWDYRWNNQIKPAWDNYWNPSESTTEKIETEPVTPFIQDNKSEEEMIQKAVDKRTALKDTKTKVDEVTGKR